MGSDIVQPDLLFVRRENAGIVGERCGGHTDRRDLVAWLLHLDRHRKRALYERAGVPEFWLVDLANRAIEVFRLGERGYELASFAAETGPVRSMVLDGLDRFPQGILIRLGCVCTCPMRRATKGRCAPSGLQWLLQAAWPSSRN